MLLRPTGELSRGATRIRLQGQPLEVLEALLERPGELVTREQLIERLWPAGVVVEFDTALNSAIRRLRTALEDHADHPRYIETIPRRGYRFIGQIEDVQTVRAAEGTPPIDDRVEVPGNPITKIALKVPPAELGPEYEADAHPRRTWMGWAAAAAIALTVGGAWLAFGDRAAPALAAAAGSARTVAPTEARERYERGRFFFGRRGEGDTARALALFQDALRADPRMAEAWAGIASARWIDTMEKRLPRDQGLLLVRQAAQRALELDPANGEALLRLANYHWASGDKAAGERVLQQAAAVAPNHPLLLSFLSDRAMARGDFDTAVELQRKSVRLNPLAVTPRHNLVALLFVAGRYDEARKEFEQLSAISAPRFPPDTVIGQSMLLGGDPAGALQYARTLPDGVVRQQLEALSYFALGRATEADAALQRLEANTSPSTPYRVAEVYAFRGDTDAAFAWLQRGVDVDAGNCPLNECWPDAWVAALPLLRTLHGDPRWAAIRTALVNAPINPRRS
jgi:DNA-binding winged helix-turn-helix (wHTH) protein/tetratricopeptide (TPR) repeat protein